MSTATTSTRCFSRGTPTAFLAPPSPSPTSPMTLGSWSRASGSEHFNRCAHASEHTQRHSMHCSVNRICTDYMRTGTDSQKLPTLKRKQFSVKDKGPKRQINIWWTILHYVQVCFCTPNNLGFPFIVLCKRFAASIACITPSMAQSENSVQVTGMWIVFVYGVLAVFFVFSIMAVELGLISLMGISACFGWVCRQITGSSPPRQQQPGVRAEFEYTVVQSDLCAPRL